MISPYFPNWDHSCFVMVESVVLQANVIGITPHCCSHRVPSKFCVAASCLGMKIPCLPFLLACLLNIYSTFKTLSHHLFISPLTPRAFYIKEISFCNVYSLCLLTMQKPFPFIVDLMLLDTHWCVGVWLWEYFLNDSLCCCCCWWWWYFHRMSHSFKGSWMTASTKGCQNLCEY